MAKSRRLGIKWLIIFVLLGVLAYALISPSFQAIERNDPLPLVVDSTNVMGDVTRDAFDSQVEAMKDIVISVNDAMDPLTPVLLGGNFIASAHEVKGKAFVVDTPGGKVLRLENFETINGPNLHVYLASSLSSGDFIDLGKIRATKGNVNYPIPSGTDLTKYDKVLIWCVPFSVLFSYAELS